MRVSDKWLPWVALVGPIMAFMIGVCLGGVGSFVLLRQYDKRIAKIEAQAYIAQAVIVELEAKGIIK